MGKIRTMGAGLGGSTAKNVNVNSNTGGGNKKQGLSTTTNKRVQFVSNAIKTRSYGEHRNFVFCMNQLGGVGAVGGGNGSRMFGTTSDGVKDCITGPYGCEQVVREAYLEAYGREPDKSGLRTYCIAMTKRRWSKADIVADLKKNEDSLAPIYASLEGNYLMYIYDHSADESVAYSVKAHIDNQGNITVSLPIGKITVNSEDDFSLTMAQYGVTNTSYGGKYKAPVGSYGGGLPKIDACGIYFYQPGNGADLLDREVIFKKDSDNDGVDDFYDDFPNDDGETQDTDGDGVGDNADAFPNDSTETDDADGDGVGDNTDAFPNDAGETQDTDGGGAGGDDADDDDGVGDNADDDGVGDDDDNDGVGDDADDDGVGDDADDDGVDDDADDDGVVDNADDDGVGDNADDDDDDDNDGDNDGDGDNTDPDLVSGYTLTVSEHATDLVEGQTTYRVYVDMVNTEDFLSSVYGNDGEPLYFVTENGFYNNQYGSTLASGINPALFEMYGGLQADSWITIGIDRQNTSDEVTIRTVEDENEPYLDRFVQSSENSGQDFVINTITGGAWYTLKHATNGLPDENGQVLVMQFTTSGSFNGRFNIQIFRYGDGGNDVRKTFIFNGVGTFSSSDDNADGFAQYEGSTAQKTAQNIINAFGTDGKMTLNQLAEFLAEINNTTIEEELAEGAGLLAALDTNNDDVINVDELAAAFGGEDKEGDGDGGGFAKYEGSTAQKTAQNIINAFGTDGKMTLNQLAEFLAEINNTTIEEELAEGAGLLATLDTLDTNNDGVINVDELAAAFGGEDNDGDGEGDDEGDDDDDDDDDDGVPDADTIEVVLQNEDSDQEYNYVFKVSGSPSTPLDFFKIPTDTNPEAGVSVKESGLKISLEVIKQASGESMGVLQMDEIDNITFNFLTNNTKTGEGPITLSEFKIGEFNPGDIEDINFFNISLTDVHNDLNGRELHGATYFVLSGLSQFDDNFYIAITFPYAPPTKKDGPVLQPETEPEMKEELKK